MDIIQNLLGFVKSIPTNLIILFIIGIILRLLGKPFSTIAKMFTLYFLICFLLSLIGIRLPSLIEIFTWIKDTVVRLYNMRVNGERVFNYIHFL